MRSLLFALLLTPLTLAAQQPQIVLQRIVSGLNLPLGIVHAGDSRLFIVLQRGQILIYDGTNLLATPFLDIRSLVSCCDERGLLGLAFHPHYAENGFFFVYYTMPNGDIALARYRVSANRDRADPASSTIVLTISHPDFPNHNGGNLVFGPDGYLYLGPGDGGSGGDPHNNAQDLSQLLGKILRIDVDPLPYGIPASNPFRNTSGARPEIWAYGIRNAWRFTFDRDTGDLLIADVGQDLWEEVDFQPASSIGGENYGWRRMEGTHCYIPSTNCQTGSLVTPILEYSHSEGCSITGGYRYRGTRYPLIRGMYFFGDYCAGTIWGAMQQSDGTWIRQTLLTTLPKLAISTFGEDANGELYVADLNGSIYRITETTPTPARRRAVRK